MEFWWWRFGLPSPIWWRNVDVIKRIVEKNKLQPFPESFLDAQLQQQQFQQQQLLLAAEPQMVQMEMDAPARSKAPRRIRPLPFPGGLKIAHVHYEGQVYPLERQQWQEFSTGVVQRLRENLDQARVVGFQQLMEVSDVLETF